MVLAFAGLHARTILAERLPVPDAVVGAAEDAIVLCLIALATREGPPEEAADAAERRPPAAAAWPRAWRRRRSAPRR